MEKPKQEFIEEANQFNEKIIIKILKSPSLKIITLRASGNYNL